MTDVIWSAEYTTDLVFCDGGKKLERRRHSGFVSLTKSGISIEPDDGYYSGELDPEQSVALAVAVLQWFAPEKIQTP